MTQRRSPLPRALATILALAAGPLGCTERPVPAEQRILVLDGIEIRFTDVEPYVAFLDSFQPETGRKTKIRYVIEEYLLPLAVARRRFATERAALREQAKALASVASNSNELERQSAAVEHKRRANLTRTKLQLPVSMFLFDPLRTNSVSEPIEVPQGYYVVTCYDLHQSPLMVDDYVDALQVGFVTHTAAQWGEFYVAEQQRLADKCTFVHPDFRDSLPDWIHPPRTP